MDCYCILIKGIVQGVGFRPFVYKLAQSLNINGFVTNSSEGVIIEVEGGKIERFIQILQHNPPPLSRIDSISIRKIGFKRYKDFKIIHSIVEGSFTHISPDISICKDCLKELFAPTNKKYLYPFINCTNCGPRYTITQKVPYDRPNTTMAAFKMCLDCQKEYDNPLDRRFHAQPNACPQCGPQLELKIINQRFKKENNKNPIDETISLLRQGAIVAIKGLGGFHLCADALNSISVAELRQRKRRRNKPFAIMSPDIETIKNFCFISKDEETILQSSQRPIVLLKKRDSISLSDDIASKNKELGFMMPYTPLHYLLFYKDIKKQNFPALIMTSGNISEEPIVIDNEDAISRLSCIADAFLLHNRDIFMRVDDSVVRVFEGDTLFIRRGRGYSPLSVNIEHSSTDIKNWIPQSSRGMTIEADILATGADIKNSFAITKDNSIIMSQYIGDMENLETLNFFEETLANLQQVYRANPQHIVYDMHPAYMTTQWALKKSQKENIKSYAIQHHYAHILSVMAENNLKDKVIGIAFDGTGYGMDGNIWGSEFFVCDIDGFERFAHFKYMPLPGGDMAIKECYRTAISLIRKSLNDKDFYRWMDKMDFVKKQGADKISNILNILDNKNFSPLSSGAGRLFDAVSSILSVCDINTFEGEAAIALESLIDENMNFDSTQVYSFEVTDTIPAVIDFSKMIIEILEDIGARDKGVISNRFHNTIIKSISFIVQKIRDKYNINEVALSGGVFQNRYILRNTIKILTGLDCKVYLNKIVPCNDAGISLGQCYVLAERLRRKKIMKPNKLFKKTPLIATSLIDRDIPNLNSSLLLNVDLIELRVDMFDDISTAGIKNTFKVARKIKKPIIATVRDIKEGGQKKINNRLDIYKTVISLSEICDVEINSDIFKDIKKLCLAHNKFLIGSYHNFKITPNDKFIEYMIRKGKGQGADIVKIAVMPQITKDVTRLFLLTLKHSKGDIITISMGAKGKISRFINPMVGSMVTYGYIYRQSAEGQPSVDDLRRAFNLLGFG